MNDTDIDLEFNRGAVRPVQCLKESWQLIKDDYWVFLGVTLVGMLIASAAAIILAGPMMCGIDVCVLRRMNGQRTRFNDLFEGFNFFGTSFVASLFPTAAMIVLLVVIYIGFCGAMFGLIAAVAPQGGGQPENPGLFVAGMFGIEALFVLAIMAGSVLVQLPFTFIYPLIVDHNLSAMAAVRLSVRAALANVWGLLGLILLQTALGFVGVLACYFGIILVLPVSMASNVVAYRHVFPKPPAPREVVPVDDEEPFGAPSLDSAPPSTGIQAEAPREATPETGFTPGAPE